MSRFHKTEGSATESLYLAAGLLKDYVTLLSASILVSQTPHTNHNQVKESPLTSVLGSCLC